MMQEIKFFALSAAISLSSLAIPYSVNAAPQVELTQHDQSKEQELNELYDYCMSLKQKCDTELPGFVDACSVSREAALNYCIDNFDAMARFATTFNQDDINDMSRYTPMLLKYVDMDWGALSQIASAYVKLDPTVQAECEKFANTLSPNQVEQITSMLANKNASQAK